MDRQEFDTLRGKVRGLKDRAEIRDCLLRYVRGVDRFDWEQAASAYHADAIDDRGAHTGTRDEYLAWLRPILAGASGTSHSLSNMTCEIDGDTAHTEFYVITAVWSDERKTVLMGGARYISRFERRDGEWKMSRQEGPMDFTLLAPADAMPAAANRGKRSREDRSYARPLDLTDEAWARYEAKTSTR